MHNASYCPANRTPSLGAQLLHCWPHLRHGTPCPAPSSSALSLAMLRPDLPCKLGTGLAHHGLSTVGGHNRDVRRAASCVAWRQGSLLTRSLGGSPPLQQPAHTWPPLQLHPPPALPWPSPFLHSAGRAGLDSQQPATPAHSPAQPAASPSLPPAVPPPQLPASSHGRNTPAHPTQPPSPYPPPSTHPGTPARPPLTPAVLLGSPPRRPAKLPRQLGRLQQQVLHDIRSRRLLPHNQRVLVAVSGSQSSVALAHVLASLCGAFGWQLLLAHCQADTGNEAAEQAAAVTALAQQLKLPLLLRQRTAYPPSQNTSTSTSTSHYTSTTASIHSPTRWTGAESAAAWQAAALREMAAEEGAHCVALGLTATDLAAQLLGDLLLIQEEGQGQGQGQGRGQGRGQGHTLGISPVLIRPAPLDWSQRLELPAPPPVANEAQGGDQGLGHAHEQLCSARCAVTQPGQGHGHRQGLRQGQGVECDEAFWGVAAWLLDPRGPAAATKAAAVSGTAQVNAEAASSLARDDVGDDPRRGSMDHTRKTVVTLPGTECRLVFPLLGLSDYLVSDMLASVTGNDSEPRSRASGKGSPSVRPITPLRRDAEELSRSVNGGNPYSGALNPHPLYSGPLPRPPCMVRSWVLPYLRHHFHPRIDAVLARTSLLLAAEQQVLAQQSRQQSSQGQVELDEQQEGPLQGQAHEQQVGRAGEQHMALQGWQLAEMGHGREEGWLHHLQQEGQQGVRHQRQQLVQKGAADQGQQPEPPHQPWAGCSSPPHLLGHGPGQAAGHEPVSLTQGRPLTWPPLPSSDPLPRLLAVHSAAQQHTAPRQPLPSPTYPHPMLDPPLPLPHPSSPPDCQPHPPPQSQPPPAQGRRPPPPSSQQVRQHLQQSQPGLPPRLLLPLLLRVHQDILDRELLAPGQVLLLAVSGGQDSLLLAWVLAALSGPWSWRLVLAHCDHGWRADSAANARHVADLAASWLLPCRQATAPPGLRSGGEAAARAWRYTCLERMACEAGCDVVVVGHTLTDQVETLLLNLFRGAGLDGLQAMRWTRQHRAPGSPGGQGGQGGQGGPRGAGHYSRSDQRSGCSSQGTTGRSQLGGQLMNSLTHSSSAASIQVNAADFASFSSRSHSVDRGNAGIGRLDSSLETSFDDLGLVPLAEGEGDGGVGLAWVQRPTSASAPGAGRADVLARPVVRPLLGVTRSETAAACAALGLPVWEDSTNAQLDTCQRNRVRLELMPALAQLAVGRHASPLAVGDREIREGDVSPTASLHVCSLSLQRSAVEVLERELATTAETWRKQSSLLDGLSRIRLQQCREAVAGKAVKWRGDRVLDIIDRRLLATQPLGLQRRVVRLLLGQLPWSHGQLTFELVEQVQGLLTAPSGTSSGTLGWVAVTETASVGDAEDPRPRKSAVCALVQRDLLVLAAGAR